MYTTRICGGGDGSGLPGQVFGSGNSLALRLPKTLAFREGDEMALREDGDRYVIEPAEASPRTIDLAGIAGSIRGWSTPERRIMEPRELGGKAGCWSVIEPVHLPASNVGIHVLADGAGSAAARLQTLRPGYAAASAYAHVPFRRGRFDRPVAAQARAPGLTLGTNDEAGFADVPGLPVDNRTDPL